MTRPAGNPAHALFRKLASSLDIREKSENDRDRKLYNAVCQLLGMGSTKPLSFFTAHPEITELRVLVAFLDAMEPFSKMIEAIFSLCSETARGATGGNDIAIKYDAADDTLRFDVEAYKRYRRIRSMVRSTGVLPRYHSDYVPMYGHILKELVLGGHGLHFGGREHLAPCTVEFLSHLFSRAKSVGEAHVGMLDEFFASIGGNCPSEDEVKHWFTDRGIEGLYIPSTPDRVQSWRSSMKDGLDALLRAEPTTILNKGPLEEVTENAQRLMECIGAISVVSEALKLQEAVEEWLSLPYWKKRWQVYEVWVYSECQREMLDAGGRFNVGHDRELVLHTGTGDIAQGVLPLRGPFQLELWCEYPLGKHARGAFRLDLAFVLRTPQCRIPLHFVECKQRIGVSASGMAKDASKYLPFMPTGTMHFLVNYDPFDSDDMAASTDDHSRCITVLGDVRPDEPALQEFRKHIGDLLSCGRLIYILLDTTGSMHSKIATVARHCEELAHVLDISDTVKLILYGDHDDPYTVKDWIETRNLSALVDAILKAPLTQGGDNPEALEDALHFVRGDIQQREFKGAEVVVFADATAHDPANCPHGYDFRDELHRLRLQGTHVTLLACGTELVALGWDALSDARVTTMNAHAWPGKGSVGV